MTYKLKFYTIDTLRELISHVSLFFFNKEQRI